VLGPALDHVLDRMRRPSSPEWWDRCRAGRGQPVVGGSLCRRPVGADVLLPVVFGLLGVVIVTPVALSARDLIGWAGAPPG
jgi:hypothetical protein